MSTRSSRSEAEKSLAGTARVYYATEKILALICFNYNLNRYQAEIFYDLTHRPPDTWPVSTFDAIFKGQAPGTNGSREMFQRLADYIRKELG